LPKRFKFKVEDFNLFAANEREVIAVLRLVYRTTRNFPGVFYHGKASAVLPVVGRVLPFFAEPAFRLVNLCEVLAVWCRILIMLLCVLLILFGINDFSFGHGVIFKTIGSLLSLLRSGAQDAYRQFFVDSMLVVEGIKKFFLNLFFFVIFIKMLVVGLLRLLVLWILIGFVVCVSHIDLII
jgi:hypothetical protein